MIFIYRVVALINNYDIGEKFEEYMSKTSEDT